MHKVAEIFIGLIVLLCALVVIFYVPEPNSIGYLLVHLSGFMGILGACCLTYDRLNDSEVSAEWSQAIRRAKDASKRDNDK